ncbi:MAG: hypothetical protein HY985_01420 [Magnetospirillum sp.]|nr:hypothetical protein [Magnetospirillum sp.]
MGRDTYAAPEAGTFAVSSDNAYRIVILATIYAASVIFAVAFAPALDAGATPTRLAAAEQANAATIRR